MSSYPESKYQCQIGGNGFRTTLTGTKERTRILMVIWRSHSTLQFFLDFRKVLCPDSLDSSQKRRYMLLLWASSRHAYNHVPHSSPLNHGVLTIVCVKQICILVHVVPKRSKSTFDSKKIYICTC